MRLPVMRKIGYLLVAIMAASSGTDAAVMTIPPDLLPGDQYRLVFVTSTARGARSTNIADYDDFVAAAANSSPELASLASTWHVIGSTQTVDAYSHIGGSFAMPVYRLDGLRVADNSADLWDGSIQSPITLDEAGLPTAYNFAFTGTSFDGASSIYPLGFDAFVTLGTFGCCIPSDWISNGIPAINGGPGPFYAISGTLVVPEMAVPEPGTAATMVLGAMVVIIGPKGHRRILLVTLSKSFSKPS